MSYRPKYFQLHEVVHAQAIVDRGEQAWQLMDERILRGADWLRELFGAITINGKFNGGGFTESGLRDPFTEIGSKYSQHKFGRALDLKFHKVTVAEVYDYIIRNPSEARANGITCIEDIRDTKGKWLHVDCRLLPESFPDNGVLVVRG